MNFYNPIVSLAAQNDAGIFFQPANFLSSLAWLAKGMIGIMVVMGAIIIATALLNRFASKKKKEQD